MTTKTDRGANPPVAEPGRVADPRLETWERVMNPVILAAALVPIGVAFLPRAKDNPFAIIDSASWLVFLADFVVHLWMKPGYLRSGLGKFDAGIVTLTFPWYLIPGLGGAAILGLARLGRLLRLVLAGGTTGVLRRLAARLGKAGLYSLVLIGVCSFVVSEVEPASSGFNTLGDSFWWGFVTFTTVGYGDLYPVSTPGRIVAVFLMIGGIALIGLLAGSLAEFLSEGEAERAESAQDAAPDSSEVLAEVQALRIELGELRELLSPPPEPSSL